MNKIDDIENSQLVKSLMESSYSYQIWLQILEDYEKENFLDSDKDYDYDD